MRPEQQDATLPCPSCARSRTETYWRVDDGNGSDIVQMVRCVGCGFVQTYADWQLRQSKLAAPLAYEQAVDPLEARLRAEFSPYRPQPTETPREQLVRDLRQEMVGLAQRLDMLGGIVGQYGPMLPAPDAGVIEAAPAVDPPSEWLANNDEPEASAALPFTLPPERSKVLRGLEKLHGLISTGSVRFDRLVIVAAGPGAVQTTFALGEDAELGQATIKAMLSHALMGHE